jgi:hypothetical protein
VRVLIYSLKGGQGKTTHSVSYAQYAGLKMVTNDHQNGTLEIYGRILPRGHLKAIKPGERFDPAAYPDTVFDFAGAFDERVVAAARASDVCVVPICFQSTADAVPALSTVATLQRYTREIVVVINNTEKDEVEVIQEILKAQFPTVPVFVVNRSRYIWRLADEGRTLLELVALGGLYEHSLRNMVPQIKALYRHLDQYRRIEPSSFEPVRLFANRR